ncbi:hypothetical protein [Jiangella asiatica]|uniref:Uncharacterized protein n=1 Tax=Jiangella asiatica TaxID=2530372 RepID=A0A4R5D3S2_9ACTN|nr:hypothetical protein [Jiangella asiatica]TDE08022.1 hypothetical protein E1269_18980 [Jiangella asiatica]
MFVGSTSRPVPGDGLAGRRRADATTFSFGALPGISRSSDARKAASSAMMTVSERSVSLSSASGESGACQDLLRCDGEQVEPLVARQTP